MAKTTKKRAARSTTPKAPAGGRDLVVKSKVKELVAALGMRSEGTFCEALSDKVAAMVTAATQRARAHGKQTVRGADL